MVDPAAARKSASKKRLRWEGVPAVTQSVVERLAGGQVVAATNCTGGFSPGLASRLAVAGGREVFVKAMDAAEWPDQALFYRAEALVSASLPAHVPAPRLLGSSDDGRWVVLVFEWSPSRAAIRGWAAGLTWQPTTTRWRGCPPSRPGPLRT